MLWADLAEFEGASGSVIVTGTGSTWTVDEHVVIGLRGPGTLQVENSGAA